MNQTRELLRPGVQGFEPMPDAFERVLARRDRKRRNQRVAAGVLGIALFALALIGLARLLDSRPTPALPEPPLPVGNGRWIVIGAQHLDPDPTAPDAGRGNPQQLFVASAGTEPRLLVGAEGDRTSRDCPSFSPDGTMLAWGEKRNLGIGGGVAIVVSGFSSSGELVGRQLRIPLPIGDQGLVSVPCPTWAPIGERLAVFVPGHGVLFADAGGEATLVTLDEVGAEDTAFEMAWSPDASAVAVTITPGRGTERLVWVVPADGGAPVRLTPSTPRRSPDAIAWTSDGRAVVVAGTEEDSPFVESIDVSTAGTTDVPAPERWAGTFLVQLFAAGDDRFVVMRIDDAGGGWLTPEILDLRGRVTSIADPGYGIGSFVGLSPDGEQLLFVGYDRDRATVGGALFAVPLDGGPATPYSPWTNGFGDNYGTFAWQPVPERPTTA